MKANTTKEMQLAFDRSFKAPIKMVFDALTLPEHLKHWDCPDHLDITFAESKPNVDGEYKIGLKMKNGEWKITNCEY